MKVLTEKQALDWCRAWPLLFDLDDAGVLSVPGQKTRFTIDISRLSVCQLLPLARSLTFLGCHDVERFSGALLWIKTLGIGVHETEQIAWKLMEKFRLGYGEARSLESAKAHLFRSDEPSDLAAALLPVLVADWDAYLVNGAGEWVVLIDHDDHLFVTSKSEEIAADLKGSLERWGPMTNR